MKEAAPIVTQKTPPSMSTGPVSLMLSKRSMRTDMGASDGPQCHFSRHAQAHAGLLCTPFPLLVPPHHREVSSASPPPPPRGELYLELDLCGHGFAVKGSKKLWCVALSP